MAAERRSKVTGHAARGFTLLEMLVVLGVLAVLLGITLPVLQNVRQTVRERAVLAHQRQTGLELLTYLNDHDGAFPYAGIPGSPRVRYPIIDGPDEGQTREYDTFYWIQMYLWAYLCVVDGYTMDAAFTGPEFPDRKGRPPGAGYTVDWMTSAAFARPRYFAPGNAQDVADLVRQRIQITSHPSRKGILQRMNYFAYVGMTEQEWELKYWATQAFVWFADGHAAMHAPGAMRQPTVGLPGHSPPPAEPVLVTDNGLLGRDL